MKQNQTIKLKTLDEVAEFLRLKNGKAMYSVLKNLSQQYPGISFWHKIGSKRRFTEGDINRILEFTANWRNPSLKGKGERKEGEPRLPEKPYRATTAKRPRGKADPVGLARRRETMAIRKAVIRNDTD